jgi:hypothetical protein
MKYLVLAYGAEADWVVLSPEEQKALLAQDAVLRGRGDLVAAVRQETVTVRAPGGVVHTEPGAFARPAVPLAGFGIIEAADLDEAVALVANTPCARAGGAVELRPIFAMNDWAYHPER